jgi:hypothetical protein
MKHFFEIIFISCLYFPLQTNSSLLEEVDENFIPITHNEDVAIRMETLDSAKHSNEISNKELHNESSSNFKFSECFQRILPIAIQITIAIILVAIFFLALVLGLRTPDTSIGSFFQLPSKR